MVSSRQEKEIQRLMRRIKDARDEEMGEEVIRSRTQELVNYLDKEGLINRFNE